MIKNNLFRGTLYTFLTIVLVFVGLQMITKMGASLDMTAVEFYTAVGYKGLIMIGVALFVAINLYLFAFNNYKLFVLNAAGKEDKRKAGLKIVTKLYKVLLVGAVFAGAVYVLAMKTNLLELVTKGNLTTIIYTGLTVITVALLFAIEFAELIFVIIGAIKNRKPKAKKIKVKKAKANKQPNKVETKVETTEVKKETPIFRFGKR